MPSSLLGRPSLELTWKPDELHRVPTDDGASIALGRYHARGRKRFEEPVILGHGLGANRFNLDLDERYSLAQHLAGRGFETWVLELRGRGLAGPPVECTFDDQAQYDLRAAIRAVRNAGHRAVTWVGHSKGGLALYAHLALNPDAPIKAAVTLGSPFTFSVQPGLKAFIARVEPLLKMKIIPVSHLKALAPLGPPPGPISRYLALHSNMDLEVTRKLMFNSASDVAGGVARQFARWITTGNFDSYDGAVDYRARLNEVKVPFLLVAGSRDLLAPPMAVARAQNHLGGAVKLVVAGRGHGFAADYGHGDLVLGRHAPDEVFPVVETFLATHSTPA